jgi:hypothetical protein
VSTPRLFVYNHLTNPAAHGVRTVDNLKRWCGLTDQTQLEVGESEARRWTAADFGIGSD